MRNLAAVCVMEAFVAGLPPSAHAAAPLKLIMRIDNHAALPLGSPRFPVNLDTLVVERKLTPQPRLNIIVCS